MVGHHWKTEAGTTSWTLWCGLEVRNCSVARLFWPKQQRSPTHTHTMPRWEVTRVVFCHCLFEVGWVWPGLAAAKANWARAWLTGLTARRRSLASLSLRYLQSPSWFRVWKPFNSWHHALLPMRSNLHECRHSYTPPWILYSSDPGLLPSPSLSDFSSVNSYCSPPQDKLLPPLSVTCFSPDSAHTSFEWLFANCTLVQVSLLSDPHDVRFQSH